MRASEVCGRDEEHGFQAVFLEGFLVELLVLIERQVGQNEAIDAHGGRLAAELLHPKLHHRVEVAHEQHRRFGHGGAQALQLLEQHRQVHAVGQGHRAAALNDRAIGQRVGKGHADFEDVGPGLHQGFGQRNGVVQAGVAGREVDVEQVVLAREGVGYSVHELVPAEGAEGCAEVAERSASSAQTFCALCGLKIFKRACPCF